MKLNRRKSWKRDFLKFETAVTFTCVQSVSEKLISIFRKFLTGKNISDLNFEIWIILEKLVLM